MDLQGLQKQIASQKSGLPPVEKWDPPFCGDMDLVIKHDGSWHYMGTPIGRQSLVRMFASVLKKEQADYYLVTPVEKIGIQVEDVPFIVDQWQQQNEKLIFTTNTKDVIIVGQDNPVVLSPNKLSGEMLPYCLVRRNLYARLHQNVFYQLVELGVEQPFDGANHLVLNSGNYAFSLGEL